ncbi:hypothetical protein N0V88_002162 [Collariella sp. IMI 366227]|nr:hypothetical protein N0V88_002162 [Collariella sp. IMI 366227]
MAAPKFHVAIDSPPGTAFPSFPSSAMEGGDVTKITLAMIRNKCSISNKFFFTIDGKTRVDDATTLSYLMSLTAEGQKLLQPPSTGTTSGGDPAAASPGVPTFVVKVADSTVKKDLVELPGNNEALTKLLEGISNNTLTKGTLPTFADRQLTSLMTSYASALVAGRVYSYTEPAELTELQWDSVFKNNRAFHGYYYDFKLSTLMTAPKAAFRLRGAAPVGKPPTTSTAGAPVQQYLPAIPPYYVHDRASVKVIEVRSQQQNTWIKDGFNSMAIGGSLGGGPASVPASVTASWEKEHSYANQKREITDVQSLAVTYNVSPTDSSSLSVSKLIPHLQFPRAVIEFDTDTLELTEQCRQDALKVATTAARDKFFREYGTVFVTRLTLGGFLYSTRSVKSTELSSLDQVKDVTRIAAGISAQTPKVSGSLNFAKTDSSGTEIGKASLFQEDYRLWRLMNKERIVSLEYLIKDLDTEPWHRLTNPTAQTNAGKNVLTDQAFQDYVRTLVMDAVNGGAEDNSIVRKMADSYATDMMAKVTAYNSWMKQNFPDEDVAIIGSGILFTGLSLDQKVGFGLWMTSKGELTFA